MWTLFGLADHGSLVIAIVFYVYTLTVARPYSGIVCRLRLTVYVGCDKKRLGPRRRGNGVTLILGLRAPYIHKSIKDLEIKHSLMLDIKHT